MFFGSTWIVTYFIFKGADPELKNLDGDTPLHVAIKNNSYDAAKALSEKNGVVIAAGGGTLTFRENVDSLKKSGVIILLDLPVETVAARLKNDTTRPLLNRPDKEKAMKELYDKRLPLYRAAADIVVNAEDSPMQVCREIMDFL